MIDRDEHDQALTANDPAPSAKAENASRLTQARARFQARLGLIVLAMISLPRYRNHAIGDLVHLALEPLSRGRVSFAQPSGNEAQDALAGIAIWATVSDDVDR